MVRWRRLHRASAALGSAPEGETRRGGERGAEDLRGEARSEPSRETWPDGTRCGTRRRGWEFATGVHKARAPCAPRGRRGTGACQHPTRGRSCRSCRRRRDHRRRRGCGRGLPRGARARGAGERRGERRRAVLRQEPLAAGHRRSAWTGARRDAARARLRTIVPLEDAEVLERRRVPDADVVIIAAAEELVARHGEGADRVLVTWRKMKRDTQRSALASALPGAMMLPCQGGTDGKSLGSVAHQRGR